MRGFGSMIKLHKAQVDDRRRELAALEAQAQELALKLKHLDAEMAAEAGLVADDPSACNTYAAYLAAANVRRETLRAAIYAMGRQITGAQERVAAAYRELKKYEIAEENRLRELALQRARREQAELDEVALNMFRRQKSD
ncbi:MAG: flagellar FliJ family protein [Alphaproteobacteria bacterium]|nr:flagellar FliJ family protein [Alphaproteobacteria bacterium]